jgi:Recombination endonuclease VII
MRDLEAKSAYDRDRYEKLKEQKKLYARQYRDANRAKIQEIQRRANANLSPEKRLQYAEMKRRAKRLRLYGITPEQYAELYRVQQGMCKLCRHPTRRGSGGDLDVDHCHETGRIRGLLCVSCNHALGVLGDNVKGLEMAIKYLKGEDVD